MKVVASGDRNEDGRRSDAQRRFAKRRQPKREDNLRRLRRRKKILFTKYCESNNPDTKANNTENILKQMNLTNYE